ncbi:single-stranded DNA-binding protein [Halobacillus karajensis]|uniref:Single-stranded DNA-binding protein n=1 Tax=Halobacillus karajensis TaxID=195088 RepID=A0A059NWA3_9BACI|nr:single-stranded DNA-binding protein [Halobacillus karajensis]CDQ22598.1 Helix-destabilizing protein [Halobacillus karajensis]CDQ26080.1 Helix-destabilizing protein [Halobacillus karajensis]
MNKVFFTGNIATDIDLRYSPNGHAIANFVLAVNHPFNRDKTFFLPHEVWRKPAENVAQYCAKGSKIAVEAHVEVDEWEKDGQKRNKTKFVADSIEFLDTRKKENNQPPQQNQQNNDDPLAENGEPVDIEDSDLPF